MNETTQFTTEPLTVGVMQSDMMTRELERLYLLNALKVGLDQLNNGQTVLANDVFFDGMETRLFNNQSETVIEA